MKEKGKKTQVASPSPWQQGLRRICKEEKKVIDFGSRNFTKLSPGSFCFLCESEKGTRREGQRFGEESKNFNIT